MELKNLEGFKLGNKKLSYSDKEVILYALSVGAKADDLNLIFERELVVIPTYACALGLWGVESAGDLGIYDRNKSLHASQKLIMHEKMPIECSFWSSAKILKVFDKGKAALVDIEVKSEFFTAIYSVFLPGMGGWGGDRGLSSHVNRPIDSKSWSLNAETNENQAALYRLTGDRHPIHIDTKIAKANGFDRPILHGLCTMGIVLKEICSQLDLSPSGMLQMQCKLSAPVFPGDSIRIVCVEEASGRIRFDSYVRDSLILKDGLVFFGIGQS